MIIEWQKAMLNVLLTVELNEASFPDGQSLALKLMVKYVSKRDEEIRINTYIRYSLIRATKS